MTRQHRVKVTLGEARRLLRTARRLWPSMQVNCFGLALQRNRRMWVTLDVSP